MNEFTDKLTARTLIMEEKRQNERIFEKQRAEKLREETQIQEAREPKIITAKIKFHESFNIIEITAEMIGVHVKDWVAVHNEGSGNDANKVFGRFMAQIGVRDDKVMCEYNNGYWLNQQHRRLENRHHRNNRYIPGSYVLSVSGLYLIRAPHLKKHRYSRGLHCDWETVPLTGVGGTIDKAKWEFLGQALNPQVQKDNMFGFSVGMLVNNGALLLCESTRPSEDRKHNLIIHTHL